MFQTTASIFLRPRAASGVLSWGQQRRRRPLKTQTGVPGQSKSRGHGLEQCLSPSVESHHGMCHSVWTQVSNMPTEAKGRPVPLTRKPQALLPGCPGSGGLTKVPTCSAPVPPSHLPGGFQFTPQRFVACILPLLLLSKIYFCFSLFERQSNRQVGPG